MTRAQKLQIYDLLKTASDSFYSISSPNFPKECPNFLDDENFAESAKIESKSEIVEKTEENANNSTKCEKLDSIAEKVKNCKRCKLFEKRTNTVFGEGVENPLVLVVGEGPGADEDFSGRPFVGAAGQLLDKMLLAIGLSRQKNCYIANAVKCRPPQNRTPFADETAACESFLEAQIAILKPKSILAAGSTALKTLMKTTSGVTRLHGQILERNGIPLLATYHPSALLRFPENKRIAWEDLKVFREKLREIAPDYEQ